MRRIGAGLLGYGALALSYGTVALLTTAVLDEPPFHPDSGDLITSWMLALFVAAVIGGLVGGWVSRRLGGDHQSVIDLIAILLGLVVTVVLIDVLIGPTPSGRAFVEKLVGPVSEDFPLAAWWEGRPQPWFAITSYVLAIIAIVGGARLAQRGGGRGFAHWRAGARHSILLLVLLGTACLQRGGTAFDPIEAPGVPSVTTDDARGAR
jgi:hypothetical protein